ncbi:MAG TPA: hypothetical protein VNG29_00660 [Candidatus Paceibacterota bacterium]|nr:hypothetical protein [Candidatus Paceibacterota bacterium]
MSSVLYIGRDDFRGCHAGQVPWSLSAAYTARSGPYPEDARTEKWRQGLFREKGSRRHFSSPDFSRDRSFLDTHSVASDTFFSVGLEIGRDGHEKNNDKYSPAVFSMYGSDRVRRRQAIQYLATRSIHLREQKLPKNQEL